MFYLAGKGRPKIPSQIRLPLKYRSLLLRNGRNGSIKTKQLFSFCFILLTAWMNFLGFIKKDFLTYLEYSENMFLEWLKISGSTKWLLIDNVHLQPRISACTNEMYSISLVLTGVNSFRVSAPPAFCPCRFLNQKRTGSETFLAYSTVYIWIGQVTSWSPGIDCGGV